jgi:hypothetical protein
MANATLAATVVSVQVRSPCLVPHPIALPAIRGHARAPAPDVDVRRGSLPLPRAMVGQTEGHAPAYAQCGGERGVARRREARRHDRRYTRAECRTTLRASDTRDGNHQGFRRPDASGIESPLKILESRIAHGLPLPHDSRERAGVRVPPAGPQACSALRHKRPGSWGSWGRS